MSKSGSHSRKPPSPGQSVTKGAVTQFGARHRHAGSDPARFKASLDPATRDLLAILEQTIDQLPDMDATRLVQLYQRISAGEYEIDAERLAEKLLELEQALNK
ncbi:MAG: flagellar biosynthesis anti-sigma factor FlgM [Dehalococcoidia bacterium]